MQPRHRHPGAAGRLPGRRRQPPLLRRAVDGRPRAGRPRPHPRPGRGRAGRRGRPGRRFRQLQPRPHLRRGGRDRRPTGSATLDAALALDPPHVSAYALTVEAGTPLARRIGAGDVAAPDDDDQAEKYLAADAALAAAGRPWYEISNWARPGRECRHNLLYWAQGEYLGIGCAAHGHTPAGRRWWNVRTPDRYIALVGRGRIRRRRPRGPRRPPTGTARPPCSPCAPGTACPAARPPTGSSPTVWRERRRRPRRPHPDRPAAGQRGHDPPPARPVPPAERPRGHPVSQARRR